jgi:hypothetical protein
MTKLDFLKEILPPGTRYSLRVIKRLPNSEIDTVRNRFYSDVEAMDADIDEYVENGWNVYYATAGFGALDKANAENAVAKKELYIDVDCGAGKPYTDKAAGLQALKEFVTTLNLPRPTLVDSGNGIHAHWVFTEAVPVHEWKSVAEALKQRCEENKFTVDAACTADIVRVLRIPETVNTKGGHTVTQLTAIKLHEFDALREKIGTTQAGMFERAKALSSKNPGKSGMSEIAKLIASNKVAKFQTIWLKSTDGKDEGCAQIKNAIENADTLSEPVWRAILSNAQFCEDRDWAIHTVSHAHPNYSPEETERKAELTKGPYTCETFQKLETAALCSGCKHIGKITAPIQLGVEIKRAPVNGKIVTEKRGVAIEYIVPNYPFPYFRGTHGGIYTKGDDGNETTIYPHDLYAYQRMNDPEIGDVVCMRYHTPRDGVREFVLAQTDIGARDKFRTELNRYGVTMFNDRQVQLFQGFVARQIDELQMTEKADVMNVRFGWTIDKSFIVGDREYTKDGVRRAPVTKNISDYIRWFTPTGSLDEWKKVAAFYEDEMFDMHALGVLAGFGSVLMQISPEHGGVLNYYSKMSGTGKTTILKVANSIYGDPGAMMKNANDTQLSKVHRMGLLNGIVTCVDEMTNIHPHEMSNLLYGSTQGRGRDRMESSRNAERVNNITWKCVSIWSSNASIEDKLTSIKVDPQGEMARVLEIYLQTPVPSDVLDTQKLFNKLNSNYGHAGDVFLRYVIPNLHDVEALWGSVKDRIYSMRMWTQTERYRLNIVICMITAGLITNALGLTNYNIKRLTQKAAALVFQAAEDMRASTVNAVEIISMFINKHIHNMLIIKDAARTNGTLGEMASTTPKGPLMVRYEPDTKSLFIAQRDFNKWCSDLYINGKEISRNFKDETGKSITVVRKRMGKGWNADFGPVSAYEIKNASEVLGVDIESELKTNDATV